MALKKDTIQVWITAQKEKGFISFAMESFQAARKKDLLLRIHGLSSKKVKGNRLEKLSWKALEENTVSFAAEYVSGLSRISGFGLFSGWYGKKSTQLESSVHKQAAQFLKDLYPDSMFEVFFDSSDLRAAWVRSWMKQNQLAGSSEAIDGQESEMLQSAALIAGLNLIEDRADLLPLMDCTKSLFSMTPNWKKTEPFTFYSSRIDQADKNDLETLLSSDSRWIEEGSLERWMKKGINGNSLGLAAELIRNGIDYERLSKINIQKLPAQFEALMLSLHADGDKEKAIKDAEVASDTFEKDDAKPGVPETKLESAVDETESSAQKEPQSFEDETLKTSADKRAEADESAECLFDQSVADANESVTLRQADRIQDAAADTVSIKDDRKDQKAVLPVCQIDVPDSYTARLEAKVSDFLDRRIEALTDHTDLAMRKKKLFDSRAHQLIKNVLEHSLNNLLKKEQVEPSQICLYLLEWENGLLLAASPVVPAAMQQMKTEAESVSLMEQKGLLENPYAMDFLPVSRVQLRLLIEWLAARKPLIRLYASSWVAISAQRVLLDCNAYLPLYELGIDEYLAVTEAYRIQSLYKESDPSKSDVSLFNQLPCNEEAGAFARLPLQRALQENRSRKVECEDATVCFLPENEYERLSLSTMRALKNLDRPLEELRPAARLLLSGIRSSQILEAARTPGRLERMEAAALSTNSVRDILNTIHDPSLLRTLIRLNLNASAIEQVRILYEKGISVEWIEANLSSRMSAHKVELAGAQYPSNRLPVCWNDTVLFESVEREHIMEQYAKAFPHKDLQKCEVQTAVFEQTAFIKALASIAKELVR